jgi:hypothetical protein
MSEEAQNRKRVILWWTMTPILALLLYVVSAWPVIYCVTKIWPRGGDSSNSVVHNALRVVYQPHILVMLNNRYYYTYLVSAYNVRDQSTRMLTWEEYQYTLKSTEEEKAKGTK